MAGMKEKALEMSGDLSSYYFDRLDYFLKQTPYLVASAAYEIQTAIQYTSKVANFCLLNGEKVVADEITARIESYYARYAGKSQAN